MLVFRQRNRHHMSRCLGHLHQATVKAENTTTSTHRKAPQRSLDSFADSSDTDRAIPAAVAVCTHAGRLWAVRAGAAAPPAAGAPRRSRPRPRRCCGSTPATGCAAPPTRPTRSQSHAGSGASAGLRSQGQSVRASQDGNGGNGSVESALLRNIIYSDL